jgi:MFS family permease
VFWFELGSLFCAVAPSVKFLIFGRAVAGMGGAGSTRSIFPIV